MKSNYCDIACLVQVIGNIYNNPNLLDATDKYFFLEEDFANDFQKIVFGSIYNLHQLGAKNITIEIKIDPNHLEKINHHNNQNYIPLFLHSH